MSDDGRVGRTEVHVEAVVFGGDGKSVVYYTPWQFGCTARVGRLSGCGHF